MFTKTAPLERCVVIRPQGFGPDKKLSKFLTPLKLFKLLILNEFLQRMGRGGPILADFMPGFLTDRVPRKSLGFLKWL